MRDWFRTLLMCFSDISLDPILLVLEEKTGLIEQKAYYFIKEVMILFLVAENL